jgi:carbon starvation protein CstA
MNCLVVSMSALVIGYLLYGSFVDKVFGSDQTAQTPALCKCDNVDFVSMSTWKLFIIQFINIAGLGPVFGAILGAMFGPVAYVWIVLGGIFAGGVHDYFSGMLSLRQGGSGIAEITGNILHPIIRRFMQLFTLLLLVFVGVIFVIGPAAILEELTGWSLTTLILAIFVFYLAVTIFPIHTFIGRVFPVFSVAIVLMAIGMIGKLLFGGIAIPELDSDIILNMHIHPETHAIIPAMFITIACGALSGFHSTKSPMVARCLTNEKQGRRIFYGAMIAESVVALTWATAAMSFFGGGVNELNVEMVAHSYNPAWAVNLICKTWLGTVGGALAILGVAIAPIASGSTSFRAARLIIADALSIDQKSIKSRLAVSAPIFATGLVMTKIDFRMVWCYFGLANQSLASLVLWTAAVYLAKENKFHWIASLPAVFITSIILIYTLNSPVAFSLGLGLAIPVGLFAASVPLICLIVWIKNNKKTTNRTMI